MKTVRRLLFRDIAASVMFVVLAFLSLFFFIDFVEELDGIGTRGRTAWTAVLAASYELPVHFYELFPIAVLIGTIYSLSRMAQSSEFTILRTGGLSPGRALGLLATLGVAFGLVTFVVGDFVAPASERQAVLLKAKLRGGLQLGGAGAWLKEKRSTPEGEHGFSVNVAGANAGGALVGIRIFEFDADGRLLTRLEASGPHRWRTDRGAGKDGLAAMAQHADRQRSGSGRVATGHHDHAGTVALQRTPE
jgi:lipopolysaccharide export system permease protein